MSADKGDNMMRERISINNKWLYSPSFSQEMIKNTYDERSMLEVRLPHTNAETPFHYFDESMYQFVSCYRKHIPVKPEWKDRQVNVTFDGAAHVATVYVNEQPVTTHYGGYTAFSADIGPYLTYEPGEDNVLTVVLDSRETSNVPPFGNVIDYMTYGGIYREVYLEIMNKTAIIDVFVQTKMLERETKKGHKKNEYKEYSAQHSAEYSAEHSAEYPAEHSAEYSTEHSTEQKAEHSWTVLLQIESTVDDEKRNPD